MRRQVSLPFTAASILVVSSALAGCPGTIDDRSRFLGRCRSRIDVPAQVFAAQCGDSSCHDAQSPAGELDLVSPNLERRLVGVRSSQCTSRLRIDPVDPDNSFLLEKLERDAPECGDRMPVNADPLPRDVVACVRTWVHDVADSVVDAGGDR